MDVDLDRGGESRFTFDASDNQSPVWSPDGASIAFSSNRAGGVQNLDRKINGTGQDNLCFSRARTSSQGLVPRRQIHRVQQSGSQDRVRSVGPSHDPGIPGDRKPLPLLTSEFSESMGQVSPNSRWLAYVSDETGRRRCKRTAVLATTQRSG